MVLVALISAFAGSTSAILGKYSLSKLKVEYHTYITLLFLLIFGIISVFIPFVWHAEDSAFTSINILILTAYIINAAILNVLWVHGVQREKLTESQSISLFGPLATILLAALIFPDERSLVPLLLSVVAIVAVLWSHSSHHHIRFHKGSKLLLLCVLLSSVDALFAKSLLAVYNPVTLYFLRTSIAGTLLYLFFRPHISRIKRKQLIVMLWDALSATICFTFLYWSYTLIGIVMTSLIVSISPMLAYFFARLEMKEKVTFRHFIATIVILVCVLSAQII